MTERNDNHQPEEESSRIFVASDEEIDRLVQNEVGEFRKNYRGFRTVKKSGVYLLYKKALVSVPTPEREGKSPETQPALVLTNEDGEVLVDYGHSRSQFESLVEPDMMEHDPKVFESESTHKNFGPVFVTRRVFPLKGVGPAFMRVEERIYRKAKDLSHVWVLWTGVAKFWTSDKYKSPTDSNKLTLPVRALVPA